MHIVMILCNECTTVTYHILILLIGATIPFGKNVALPYEIQVFENEHSIFQGHWYPKKPVLDAEGLISGNSFINVILFLPGLGLSAKHVCIIFISNTLVYIAVYFIHALYLI